MKRILLSLLTLTVFSTSQANKDKAQTEYDYAVYSLLKDLNVAEVDSTDALNQGYQKEFSRQQCRKLQILEDLIAVTTTDKYPKISVSIN